MIVPLQNVRRAQLKKAQRPMAHSVTLPAPFGGLNTRDSLADMEPSDAAAVDNWWSNSTFLEARKGFIPWVGNLSGYIETLLAYSGSTTNRLFAASSNGIIYNITSEDEFLSDESGNYIETEDGRDLIVQSSSTTADLTGLSNGRWQYVNMATSGGNYLRAVNGVDKSIVFTGAVWGRDGDGSPYDISGVDSATLVHINVHKERMWFVENGTLTAWYLPTKAIGGTAVAFDLKAVARKGGYLVAMGTWTVDAGYGLDDIAVWITNNGEVIIYRGTDPSSASTWALVGIFEIGSPIGRRCMIKYAGDLLVITQDGVVPLSGALQSTRTNPRVAITDKIRPTISDAAMRYSGNFGWQLVLFPVGNQLYLNVPQVERQRQVQYVMNTIKKTWWPFSGWNAGCWEIYQDEIYFGGYQFVGKAWKTNSDSGAAVSVSAVQAFNYLGRPGIQKRATMFQPIFYTDGSPEIFGGVNVDFDTTANTSQLQVQTSLFGLWDTATWDSGQWAPDLDIRKSWNGARGVGNAFAPTLNADVNDIQLQWINSTIVFEQGGIV